MVYYIFLINYSAINSKQILYFFHSHIKNYWSILEFKYVMKVHNIFPRKRNTFLSTRPMFLNRKYYRLKNTSMKNSYRLFFNESILWLVFILGVIFVIEVIFPLYESLIGDQGVILFIRNLKIPQKFQIFNRCKALIFVQSFNDLW
jgi:hypothetical protein